MDKVAASQPLYHSFEPHTGHNHDFSHDTSTGWFQEADSRVIYLSCENFLHNRAKINKFKLITLSHNFQSVTTLEYC